MTQRDYIEKDYYAILGVDKDASTAEISKAYRKLARELHPDARPDDPAAEARFKEVSEAHAVLANADKRAEYDQVRQMVGSGYGGFGGGGFPGAGYGQGDPFGGNVNVEDILGGLFGAGGGRTTRARGATGPRRGADTSADLNLSFADAMAGVTVTLRVSGRARCSTCSGSGAAPGTLPMTCEVCGGSGQTTSNQGPFSFAEVCMACGGRGQRITDPCPTCGGDGVESRTRQIRARIPAGVKDGALIRLKGKGEAGSNGGPAGDLLVRVHVAEDEVFGRKGDHLTVRVPVTMTEAALGTKVTVPTLEDPVTVKIPAGTQPGRVLRVRGRGVATAKGRKGDLLATVDVVIPEKLTRTQRQHLEAFGATEDPDALRAHLAAAVERSRAGGS